MRVARSLIAGHFGSEDPPGKRAKQDETPEKYEIICNITNAKAEVHVSNDPEALIVVYFYKEDSMNVGYPEVKQFIEFDAHIGLLYAGDLPSGMIREMLCELFKLAVARGYVRPESNIYLEACGDVNDSFSLLIQMYQRMSFVPIGISALHPKRTRLDLVQPKVYTLDRLLQDIADKKEVSSDLRMVLMVSNVQNLITWCDSKFKEDRHLLPCKDQKSLSLRVF